MNYHNIKHDDMLNGDGLRVTLFVSGCSHHCPGCQNPETRPIDSGIPFDEAAKEEIFEQLSKDYIDGITFSGGDPCHPENIDTVAHLMYEIKDKFPDKTIWLYTGYTVDELGMMHWGVNVLHLADVIVEGEFVKELADVNAPWVGSTNQNVIRKKSVQ